MADDKIVVQKKTLGQKFKETFIATSPGDVKRYLLDAVLLPTIKQTVVSMAQQGIERMILGESPQRRIGIQQRNGYWNTIDYSSQAVYKTAETRPASAAPLVSTSNRDFSTVIFPTREMADDVLTKMWDYLSEYQFVDVKTFIDLINEMSETTVITPEWTDKSIGWNDLRGVGVKLARGGGYYISLPRPIGRMK